MSDEDDGNFDRFRGYISRQHTVWCGSCGNWDQADVPKLADFKKVVVKQGWKNTRNQGWVCPKCASKRQY